MAAHGIRVDHGFTITIALGIFTMTFSRPPGRTHPKVSTMPRQQSESAHYLSIYKLTIEKKRLRHELESLDKRRDRIQNQLAALEHEIAALDEQAHRLSGPPPALKHTYSAPSSRVYPPAQSSQSDTDEPYNTLTLDY